MWQMTGETWPLTVISSLIGPFKAIQHCLMISWMWPWTQVIWLVVFCTREWFFPWARSSFWRCRNSHLFHLISRMEFPCKLFVGSRLLPAFRVGCHFCFSTCFPKHWILLRSEISWACSINLLKILTTVLSLYIYKRKWKASISLDVGPKTSLSTELILGQGLTSLG